ncbi:MAG TPA: alkaline phosphatase family protein [Patescibacteria group bacterium]|nr:alkaline phosphatase family protein [Patescibacteria group bacterium]
MRYYYVDPGSGFVFVQGTSFLWALIAGVLGGLLLFFRLFFHFFKKFIWLLCILAVAALIGGLIRMHTPTVSKKMIIFGIDAMDPAITEQLMQAGRLPNLSLLKTQGSYAHLKTTIPSETAVVWSSFATGLDPAGHGIFDFVMRDPRDYSLYLSLNEVSSAGGSLHIARRRKGDGFWQTLSAAGVPCSVYFCPNTFPPERVMGKMLSGMGVPDISGTMGRFSFYTTAELTENDAQSRGRIVRVAPEAGVIMTDLYGPAVKRGASSEASRIPLKIRLHPQANKIDIELGQGRFSLQEGAWSDWQRVSFRVGIFKRVHGIVRFYLKKTSSEFALYASPVNFDPQEPPFAISYPADYAKKLSQKVGLYYTQGMPHDTWSLSEGKLDEQAFLAEADYIMRQREAILREALKDFKGGVLFFYFDTLDMVQHMFWRYQDPQSPLYQKDSAYADTIMRYYESIDRIIGEAMRGMAKDTTCMVVSDHGFTSFRRSVHLNRWLLEKGYLFLRQGTGPGTEFLEGIDWSRTQAYALGFGGIYLNLANRERNGIVDPSHRQALKQQITQALLQLRDPKTAGAVVRQVYDTARIYAGASGGGGPDLYVGFNAGYRASWQTALGGLSDAVIEDNTKKWSGDHLVDPQVVPGVIFVNKKADLRSASILDIAPTVLAAFGIAKPAYLEGQVIAGVTQ